jgi:tetratricopeptide (TPR) repeat protein
MVLLYIHGIERGSNARRRASMEVARESRTMTKKKVVTSATQGIVAANKPNGPAAPQAGARPAQDQQLSDFESALKLFSQSRYAEAREVFGSVVGGPARNIADKARAYVQVCERKTAAAQTDFENADDHFNYGVERLNARDIEKARHHLGRALAMKPDAEYIVYTMALCCGLSGDGSGACENLKRAIELEPKNRILARQDPEFAGLSQQIPALRALLGTE